MVSRRTPLRFLEAVVLDLIALPGKFMSKKGNAKWHLRYVCPMCSEHRRKFRDPARKDYCIWEKAWLLGKFSFSKDFGVCNWMRYYVGVETKIDNYVQEFNMLSSKVMQKSKVFAITPARIVSEDDVGVESGLVDIRPPDL